MQPLISFVLILGLLNPVLEEKPFVLVELFTSEGCSSCPPADKLLSDIVNQSNEDVEVMALSFHVDYWDYIGWKDPYAQKAFTERQRSYARKFYSDQIYTPQMVVNGRHEFVGSSRAKYQIVFRTVTSEIPNYSFLISNVRTNEGTLRIQVNSSYKTAVLLNVAVVERNLEQQIIRGENSGKTLRHDNVVRVFTSRRFDGKDNSFIIELPVDMKQEDASIIVYAQDQETWEVLSAKRRSLILESSKTK